MRCSCRASRTVGPNSCDLYVLLSFDQIWKQSEISSLRELSTGLDLYTRYNKISKWIKILVLKHYPRARLKSASKASSIVGPPG